MSCDCSFKFVTLGDSAVGKTCLTYKFINGGFPGGGHETTIGVDFGCRTIPIGRKAVKLQIWDTAGQENFRSITRSYFREAAGALLVYDVSRRETFVHVVSWLEDLRQYVHPHTKIMLLGNKSDLGSVRREVSAEEGARLAMDYGLMFQECSARTGENVESAYVKTAEAVLESIRPIESHEEELKRRGVKVFESNRRSDVNYGDIDHIDDPINGGLSCCYSS
ncbi:OLC1v1037113C1 [Oldenlandia corymbosa var. corymbosa]|uniref:OLC1v1037113C1 n=1 Tax=Oldenlandia corymbosa var. corymbosa TaxID=529605 RepID=A0AAV1CYB7_OLDCO|nr:OLC1v1037113C1 [Oldenlandia corymbosa var. corymbosa]